MPRPDWYGLDIGGTKIELVACDAALAIGHRERVPTPRQDYATFIEAIAGLVARATAARGRPPVAVGLGLPGVADPDSGTRLSSNVPALNGRRVAADLQARLALPVVIGNDCQCFALSEAQGGAADDAPSMFGAILGTGAGGGYCVDGRLLAGRNGIAGEWGHWSAPAAALQRHGLPVWACPCGLTGCLERYVSGNGVAALYRHYGGHADAADAEAVLALEQAGDSGARQALAAQLDLLGAGIAALVLALDPHVIVLGGGLSKHADLYRALPRASAAHLFASARVPPILPPRFGDAGGARGAALLARQHHPGASPD